MDSGSISWMLICSALVLFMTPGLAFFYGGLVRGKNLLSTIMYSFISLGLVSIVWVLWGYTIAFGEGGNDYFGSFKSIGLNGIDTPDEQVFAIFQMMFAIITPALITGAFCERFKFKTYLIFLVLWVSLVYAPIAHWIWSEDGWLFKRGALDFAGGAVVHINAGMAAIVAAILVGKRRNPGLEPNNIPFVILGASMLWFGWFGFNAGSGLAANGQAVNAFLVTNTSAAMAMMVWVVLGIYHGGKVSAVGAATGSIAGLATITPASGFVDVQAALILALVSGLITFYAVYFKSKFNLDDALDVFAVHGIGGILGIIGTGFFAKEAIGGAKGIFEGSSTLFVENLIMIIATTIYSLIASFVILKVLDLIPALGLRSTDLEEDIGLDLSDHGERAYVSDGAD
tara:strand:- start:1177 stop:2373 length:1197 start_codon:yes stop_codon:yes gene_type:complete